MRVGIRNIQTGPDENKSYPNQAIISVQTPVGQVQIGYVQDLKIQVVVVDEHNGEDVTNFRRNGKQVSAK